MDCQRDTENKEISEVDESGDEMDNYEHMHNLEKNRQDISDCFDIIGVSPIKLHAQPLSSRVNLGKRKVTISAISAIQEKVAKTLNITPEDINLDISTSEDVDLLKYKAENFDRLMQLIKEKISSLKSTKDIIQVLTLTPTDWSIKKVADFFNVSEYAIRQARNIFKEKGILALPDSKKGKSLSTDTTRLIQSFYEDDEFTRIMPGKKDYVSISRNNHRQKRLILSNLKELYANFKTRHSHIQVGFSKFCELRPKWCVLAGSSGTHSVCVCTYHQNMKLLLAPLNISYEELFPFIVCDQNNRECMVHRCPRCPQSNKELEEFICNNIGECCDEDEIEFSQCSGQLQIGLILFIIRNQSVNM